MDKDTIQGLITTLSVHFVLTGICFIVIVRAMSNWREQGKKYWQRHNLAEQWKLHDNNVHYTQHVMTCFFIALLIPFFGLFAVIEMRTASDTDDYRRHAKWLAYGSYNRTLILNDKYKPKKRIWHGLTD